MYPGLYKINLPNTNDDIQCVMDKSNPTYLSRICKKSHNVVDH